MDDGAGAVSSGFRRGPVDMESGKNKIHTAAAVLSLAEAVCSWLVILNCMGMELPLWSIGPGMELCLRLDGTGALFSGLASLIWVLVVFFAFEYMEHEKEDARFSDALLCPWEP